MTEENRDENEPYNLTTTKGTESIVKYSWKQITLIKQMYAKDATDAEFNLFMHLSKEYGLDILKRQVWLIKYGAKYPALIFVGRDGYLDIAHRSGQFNGIETEIKKIDEGFEVKYSEWVDKKKVTQTFKSDFQYVASCKVYRKDMDKPIIVEVYEEEYSSGRDNWATKRRTMTKKVAQSQALRQAFSVSGVYAPEEMDRETVVPEYSVEDTLPSRAEVNKDLSEIDKQIDFDHYQVKFKETYGANIMGIPSGHKTNENETFGDMFQEHANRINKVNPITGQKPWVDRLAECETLEIFYLLQTEYNEIEKLQTPENEQLLEEAKKNLGFVEA